MSNRLPPPAPPNRTIHDTRGETAGSKRIRQAWLVLVASWNGLADDEQRKRLNGYYLMIAETEAATERPLFGGKA